jgi:curved DNA-binding protein
MDYIDYYEELGVPRSASKEEIEKAYRKKARKLHPDVNKAPEAEAQFKRLSEAHDVLKDPEKRSKYDQFGAAWEQAQETGSWPGGFEVRFNRGFGPQGFGSASGGRGRSGFSVFYEHLFGEGGPAEGGSIWDELFGQTTGPRVPRSLDQEAVLELTLEEALRGGPRTISLSQPGGGSRSLKVTVPAGATDGQRLRLRGQGAPGPQGSPGDLYLQIRLRPHPRFRVEGQDLHTRLDVSPAVAALGGKVRLRTLDQEIAVKVPAGSSSGRRIRLRGQGMPAPGGRRGDLYVEVRIVVPAHLSARERELYGQLSALQTKEAEPAEPSRN